MTEGNHAYVCAAAGPGCQRDDHIRLRHDAFIELGLVDEYAPHLEREMRLDGWERAQAWINDLKCGPTECRIAALRANYSVADFTGSEVSK